MSWAIKLIVQLSACTCAGGNAQVNLIYFDIPISANPRYLGNKFITVAPDNLRSKQSAYASSAFCALYK